MGKDGWHVWGSVWGGSVQTVLYVGQCCCFISLTLSFSAVKYPSVLCSLLCLCLCVCLLVCACMHLCVCVWGVGGHLWVGGWVVKGYCAALMSEDALYQQQQQNRCILTPKIIAMYSDKLQHWPHLSVNSAHSALTAHSKVAWM